jgi:hypothetical protein
MTVSRANGKPFHLLEAFRGETVTLSLIFQVTLVLFPPLLVPTCTPLYMRTGVHRGGVNP